MSQMSVEIARGNSVEIELTEAGSAGYLWDTEQADKSVVALSKNRPDYVEGPDGAIGGRSKLYLTLSGLSAGETRISHRQPWMADGEPTDVLVITVT